MQQARLDDFIECYNPERPRQAVDAKHPAALCRVPSRSHGLGGLDYPFHGRIVTHTHGGALPGKAKDQ